MQEKNIFSINNSDYNEPISILEEQDYINYSYDELPLQRLPEELNRFAALGAIGISLNGMGKRVETEHVIKRL